MLRRRVGLIVMLAVALLAAPGVGEASKKNTKQGAMKQTAAMPTSTPASESQAASENSYPKILGVGVVLGDPIGINGKYWFDNLQAVSAGVGSSLGPGRLAFYGDYLYHFYPVEETPQLPFYVGGGAFLGGSEGYFWTGVRGVAGLAYLFQEPFDVFMEIYPRFIFSPNAGFDMTLAIGGRIYFNIRQE